MFKHRQNVVHFTRAIVIHMDIIGQGYGMDFKLGWSGAWMSLQGTWETIGYHGSESIKVID